MGEENETLQNSFNNEIFGQTEEENSLEKKLNIQRINWSKKIDGMSKKMKNIDSIVSLMNEVYSERQSAVDYYHYLTSLLIRINKSYRKQFAQKNKFYTNKSQIRFPNEKTKTTQILSEMEDIHSQREQISNHVKFMSNTISTLDNIIYGIKYRMEIEHIKIGK